MNIMWKKIADQTMNSERELHTMLLWASYVVFLYEYIDENSSCNENRL